MSQYNGRDTRHRAVRLLDMRAFIDEETQAFSPARIAAALRTTTAEIADTLGLDRDSLSRRARIRADETQARLREMLVILERVEAYNGASGLMAYAWFRSAALPGFAGKTAGQLVRESKARHVHAYLDDLMAGGYA